MKSNKNIKHAVVILNYNNWEDTLACLRSIDQAIDKPHVIVVDNASKDDSVAKLRKAYVDLDLIESPHNVGFSAGNNLGIKQAQKLGAKVIYLLNNDTIVDKYLFQKAYKYVVGQRIIAGGKIYYAKGYEYHAKQKNNGNVLWYAGGHYDAKTAIAIHDHIDEFDHGQANKVKEVDFITGCFMAIPVEVIKEIGYLDSQFFLYLEDVDYCLRAQKANIKLYYNPNLILYHKNSQSTKAGSDLVDYYMTRNRFVIAARYGSLRLNLALLREALFRNFNAQNRRAALFDFLLRRLGMRTKIDSRPWLKLLLTTTLFGIALLLYTNLGRDTLFNWDEGIYAELGRELLERKNILTPSWNGELWLEKPPGVAWATALGMSIFGVNEFGARSLMPLFAITTLYFVYRIGCKLGGFRYGIIAMSLLATFNLFLSRSRAVNTDGMLLAAMTATIYFALTNASPFLISLGIFVGVWAKGIAGLLIALLILPLILRHGLSYLARVVVFSLVLLIPWHLYQYLLHGSEFYNPYLVEQVLRRATVPIEFHLESRWYYLNFLAENLAGGTLYLLVFGIIFALYKKDRSLYLVYWLCLPLVLFTLAKTRLYWYILPIYPAIALIISDLFHRFANNSLNKSMLNILAVGLCLQSWLVVARSVEINKDSSPVPASVVLAKEVRTNKDPNLLVLVPKSERDAEAILPAEQRLSSSFRYGGAPNLVFYSQKKVTYFYNLEEWRHALDLNKTSPVLLTKSDLHTLTTGYVVSSLQGDYILAIKGEYAIR